MVKRQHNETSLVKYCLFLEILDTHTHTRAGQQWDEQGKEVIDFCLLLFGRLACHSHSSDDVQIDCTQQQRKSFTLEGMKSRLKDTRLKGNNFKG